MKQTTKKFKIEGMHCANCEKLIHKRIAAIEGVHSVKVDYDKAQGEVTYDSERVDFNEISKAIEKEGYACKIDHSEIIHNDDNDTKSGIKSDYVSIDKKTIGILFAIIGFVAAVYFIIKVTEKIPMPQISQNMGYGLLLIVGLLTGFHCVSMCGGFVVSYTARDAQEGRKSHKSHLMYGIGKVISYTVIGAAFGLLGSIITFTPAIRGIAGIVAGVFLVIFGLNMLNILPFLRRIRIRTPASVDKFVGKTSRKHNSPLIIGLLNGLMIACGPLQAIYIMAAGTGSMIEGAKILFIFAIGTLPVMLSFGFLTSFISSNATRAILKASGVIVVILGLIMLNRGLALTGSGLDAGSIISSGSSAVAIQQLSGAGSIQNSNQGIIINQGYQEIYMNVTSNGWEPNKFVLKKGIPVKWIIDGQEITSCNNAITVPKLGLEFDINKGEQVIEFTPTEEGTIPWSCWMGMIRGTFIVKSDVDPTDTKKVQEALNSVNVPASSGCGCGGRG